MYRKEIVSSVSHSLILFISFHGGVNAWVCKNAIIFALHLCMNVITSHNPVFCTISDWELIECLEANGS